MPALTLGQILSEVTSALGNRLDLTPSVVSLHANIAQQQVAAMLPMTELLKSATLVFAAGSNATVIPGDFAEAVDVVRVNSFDSFGNRNLTLVPLRQIDNASEGTQAGQANRYAISASSILVYPTPSSIDTFTMRYIATPTDMVALSDRPSLHTRYHPAIYYKTAQNVANRIVDNPRAAYFGNEFISIMGTIPTPSEALKRNEKP